MTSPHASGEPTTAIRPLARRLGLLPVLGFASGLPLALTSGTLQAWLAVEGIDIATIGLFTLVGLPYVLKFLWSPFLDRFAPPFLGRRRGWMIATQLGLMAGIAAMALGSPVQAPGLMAVVALGVAFLSASQDIAFDAYRTDVLHARERGLGAAFTIGGYRLAMLVSGALALVLADHWGWQETYWFMAALMGVGVLATLASPNPESPGTPPPTLAAAVRDPLREFLARRGAVALLSLIVLYKLGDAFAGTLSTAFLIRGPGFSPTVVGTVNKAFGLGATLVGGLFGGALMFRLGLYRSLMLFGVLQAVSNLMFMWLAWSGRDYGLMVAAIGFENVAGGMGTAAFVALLMGLCNHRYTATQYALFSALAALGRVVVGPPAGAVVEGIGWPLFFLFTTLAALPGLWLLWRLRDQVDGLNHET